MVRFELRTTHLRCDRRKHDCNGRVCGAQNTKIVAADQKSPARDEKSAPHHAKRLLADFFAVVSNANALQTLQTHSLRTYRSANLYKQTANALIAVQNFTNRLQTDPFDWRFSIFDLRLAQSRMVDLVAS
jgi:hypothetical protein